MVTDNLGGLGPGFDEARTHARPRTARRLRTGCCLCAALQPRELRYEGIGRAGGFLVDLVVTNATEYIPYNSNANGLANGKMFGSSAVHLYVAARGTQRG